MGSLALIFDRESFVYSFRRPFIHSLMFDSFIIVTIDGVHLQPWPSIGLVVVLFVVRYSSEMARR